MKSHISERVWPAAVLFFQQGFNQSMFSTYLGFNLTCIFENTFADTWSFVSCDLLTMRLLSRDDLEKYVNLKKIIYSFKYYLFSFSEITISCYCSLWFRKNLLLLKTKWNSIIFRVDWVKLSQRRPTFGLQTI